MKRRYGKKKTLTLTKEKIYLIHLIRGVIENCESKILRTGLLNRLKSIDKELLYKIFCLDNQGFVAFIIKMSKIYIDTQDNQFSVKKKHSNIDIYRQNQILIPLEDFIFYTKSSSLNFNYYSNNKCEKSKAEKVGLKENI